MDKKVVLSREAEGLMFSQKQKVTKGAGWTLAVKVSCQTVSVVVGS